MILVNFTFLCLIEVMAQCPGVATSYHVFQAFISLSKTLTGVESMELSFDLFLIVFTGLGGCHPCIAIIGNGYNSFLQVSKRFINFFDCLRRSDICPSFFDFYLKILTGLGSFHPSISSISSSFGPLFDTFIVLLSFLGHFRGFESLYSFFDFCLKLFAGL